MREKSAKDDLNRNQGNKKGQRNHKKCYKQTQTLLIIKQFK